MLDNDLIVLGKEVAHTLRLTSQDGTDLYMTDWGLKTNLGLGRIIDNLYKKHTQAVTEFGLGPK